MCEMPKPNDATCAKRSAFFVHIATRPQVLGDGSTETAPAGRSRMVCAAHLPACVRELAVLEIRCYGAAPVVRPWKSESAL